MAIEHEIEKSQLLALLGRYRLELATIATERDVLRLQLGAKDKEIEEVITRLHTELLNSRLSMISEQETLWLKDHQAQIEHLNRYLKTAKLTAEPGFEVMTTTDEQPVVTSHPTGEDHGDD